MCECVERERERERESGCTNHFVVSKMRESHSTSGFHVCLAVAFAVHVVHI